MPIRNLGSGQEVPLYDYAPDLSLTTPGIVLDCSNAVPTIKGYKARNSPKPFAPALPGVPLGAYVALYHDGSTRIFAGTASNIYALKAGAWVSVGSGYTATFPWVFAQFGQDVLVTSPGNANIQVANGSAGTFGNLGGSPPNNAVSVISVAGFAAAYQTNEWFNSGAGEDVGWTPPNVQTQSGSGFLYDLPGSIVAAAPFFRNQIIWKTQSMFMLTYVGGADVWGNQILSVGTGTWGQGCVILMPTAIAFLGTDDFYITQGYAPNRIPNNFKENFFENVAQDANGNPNALQLTTSWYDPMTAVCYWHYVSNVAPFPNVPDRYVAWNSRSGRWATGHLNTPLVVGNSQPGVQSGLFFDMSNVLQSWTGPPTTMSLLTGYQGTADSLTQLQKIRISYTQGSYPTSQNLTPMHVYSLGQPPYVEPNAALAQDGWFNMRQTDRYHQALLSTFGPSEVMSLAYEMRQAGVR